MNDLTNFETENSEAADPGDLIEGTFTEVRDAELTAEVPSQRWNDANVIGDLNSPEAQAVLESTCIVGLTDRAPRVSGDKWGQRRYTWKGACDRLLTKHPVSASKGGDAFFFAESELTGKVNPKGVPWCYKTKTHMLQMFAVQLDIDGGVSVEAVVAWLRSFGLFAIIYTTHSHSTKGRPGSDRFRVILPLAEPYDLAQGDWDAVYTGIAETLPAGTDWDVSGMRPTQLMYAPARPANAEFKHLVIAGKALDVTVFEPGDPSKYRSGGASGTGKRGRAYDGEPALLSDKFDLMAWHQDHGENFLLEEFLELVGWDVLGAAGAGFNITCPNASAHTSGGDTAWAIDGLSADNGATIFCHHSHCADLATWDFVRLLEEQAVLPDGYKTLSELICDPTLYPDEVDGEEIVVERAEYIDEDITITWLKTKAAVRQAFKSLGNGSSDAAYAALYAGVAKGGNRTAAKDELDRLMSGKFAANDQKRIAAEGRKMLEEDTKAFARAKAEERRTGYAEALVSGTPDNVSLDPAEPLGNDMRTALATLAHRYAPCDIGGKFRMVRKPDLNAFNSDFDSTIVIYNKEVFLNLHLDRQVMDGDTLVNPAKVFLETEKRKSGLVFAPPPALAGPNDFNQYQGRKRAATPGDWATLKDFLLRIICDGDEEKLKWLLLWMAHMVQRPGEKPGTAVVAVGDGGIGKGRFGALLAQLTLPHFKQLENAAHLTGQFAGEHLSKCILVQVSEAVFGASPKVAGLIKAMVDGVTVQVEVKGFSLMTVASYTRLYFDSNEDVPILIEGNGSERRYFVLKVSAAEKGSRDYFEDLTDAINGPEMGALLAHLEAYDPADYGMSWSDVRTAPHTPERDVMGWHSMRPAMRFLAEILNDGEVTLTVDGSVDRYEASDAGLRVPQAQFRHHVATQGNKAHGGDADIPAMFAKLHPGATLRSGQGAVGGRQNTRWWEFPADVLCTGVGAPPAEAQGDEGAEG